MPTPDITSDFQYRTKEFRRHATVAVWGPLRPRLSTARGACQAEYSRLPNRNLQPRAPLRLQDGGADRRRKFALFSTLTALSNTPAAIRVRSGSSPRCNTLTSIITMPRSLNLSSRFWALSVNQSIRLSPKVGALYLHQKSGPPRVQR